jgi:hypothetical protein
MTDVVVTNSNSCRSLEPFIREVFAFLLQMRFYNENFNVVFLALYQSRYPSRTQIPSTILKTCTAYLPLQAGWLRG